MNLEFLYYRFYLALCSMSMAIGLNPLIKHSTAMTIRINPISRIITLLPVSPNKLINRVDVLSIRNAKK